MAKLELVLKGVKMVQASKHQPRVRQPITPQLLQIMRGAWRLQPAAESEGAWNGRMLWAAATLCFFGFLRSGEITIPNDGAFDESRHLSFGDISVDRFDNPSTLKARIKASKTDPFQGRGEHLCGAYRNQPLPSDSHARLPGGKGSRRWPSI
jgi:hypothetical protein